MAMWLYGLATDDYTNNPTFDDDNPIMPIFDATVNSRLDQKGSFEFTVPANDTRVRSLCTLGKRVILYLFDDETETKRVFSDGVIMTLSETIQDDERLFQVAGNDLLELLDREQTKYGTKFLTSSVPRIVSSLVDDSTIAPAFSTEQFGYNGEQYVESVQFDRVSLFEAIRRVCGDYGWHFWADSLDVHIVPPNAILDQGISLIQHSRLGGDRPLKDQRQHILDAGGLVGTPVYQQTINYNDCATYWNSTYTTTLLTDSDMVYRVFVVGQVTYNPSGDVMWGRYYNTTGDPVSDSVYRDNFVFPNQTVTEIDSGIDDGGTLSLYAWEFRGNGAYFAYRVSDVDSNCANNQSGSFIISVYETYFGTSQDELLIKSVSVDASIFPLANRITPYGGGAGLSILTLEASTRTSPYTITAQNQPGIGQNHPYIQNSTSVSTYGLIHRIFKKDDIRAGGTTPNDLELAANQLYDAAAAWLAKNSTPQQVYSFTCFAANQRVHPGTKVYVLYQGMAYDVLKNESVYLDIDDYFWVLGVTENYSEKDHSLTLQISNIDQEPFDATNVMVGNIGTMSTLRKDALPVQTAATYSYRENIQAGSTYNKRAKFTLHLDDSWLGIDRIMLHVITDHMWSGNDHASGNPIFRIYEDTNNYPSTIRMYINGTDVTTSYGGPWKSSSNTQWTESLDITDDILAASGGWQQRHSIEFSCGTLSGNHNLPVYGTYTSIDSSHGIVDATFQVMGVTQIQIAEASL